MADVTIRKSVWKISLCLIQATAVIICLISKLFCKDLVLVKGCKVSKLPNTFAVKVAHVRFHLFWWYKLWKEKPKEQAKAIAALSYN